MLSRASGIFATRFRGSGAEVLVWAGVLVLAGLSGCAATGVELGQGARASEGLMDSAELIREGRRQVVATSEMLDELSTGPDQPPAQHAAFTEKMDDLELAAHRVAATSDRMQQEGAAYFEAWDAEIARINNEDVRYRPEKRRKQLAETFDTLAARYARLAREYSIYIADLRGVESALQPAEGDAALNAALSRPINRAISQGEDVIEATANLAEAYEALGVRMQATAPDAAPDAAGG